jgi:hypothetical protein
MCCSPRQWSARRCWPAPTGPGLLADRRAVGRAAVDGAALDPRRRPEGHPSPGGADRAGRSGHCPGPGRPAHAGMDADQPDHLGAERSWSIGRSLVITRLRRRAWRPRRARYHGPAIPFMVGRVTAVAPQELESVHDPVLRIADPCTEQTQSGYCSSPRRPPCVGLVQTHRWYSVDSYASVVLGASRVVGWGRAEGCAALDERCRPLLVSRR